MAASGDEMVTEENIRFKVLNLLFCFFLWLDSLIRSFWRYCGTMLLPATFAFHCQWLFMSYTISFKWMFVSLSLLPLSFIHQRPAHQTVESLVVDHLQSSACQVYLWFSASLAQYWRNSLFVMTSLQHTLIIVERQHWWKYSGSHKCKMTIEESGQHNCLVGWITFLSSTSPNSHD